MAFYRIFLSITFILSFCSATIAQHKEANVWYFGSQQAIDFNSGAPVHAQYNIPMYSSGSTSVMCDANGVPLLYTNGVDVWDKTNTVMPNGTNLTANNSGLCIIVPHPAQNNLQYIFTAPFYNQQNTGFQYNLVDLNQNGGNGDVILKNQVLISSSPEKIAAVQNANDDGYWVVGHEWGSNEFHAFEITAAGLNTVPVISAVGSNHGGINFNSMGGMAISPDGSKLALNIYEDGKIEIFDFDNATGQLSNPISITGYYAATDMEFSPDGTKLYIEDNDAFYTGAPYEIVQFDLTAGTNASAIKNSATIVGTHDNYYAGIRLGPDCKIYTIALKSYPDTIYMDIIHAPNQKGVACGYQKNGLMIGNGTGNDGLPKFVPKFVNPEKCAFTATVESDDISCYGANDGTASVTPVGGTEPYNYDWSPGNQNDSSLTGLAPGTYTVVVTDQDNNTYTDSVIISEPTTIQINLSDSFSICTGDTVTLNPDVSGGNPDYTYNWNSGAATDSVYTVNPSSDTQYVLEITDSSGCKKSDTTQVIITPNIQALASGGTVICAGDSTPLVASGGAIYTWSPTTGLSDPNIANPVAFPSTTTNYSVIVSSSGSCDPDTATVTIIVQPNVTAFAGNDTSICEGESLTLNATGGSDYQWNNGSSDASITVSPSVDTSYQVIVSSGSCIPDTATVNITVSAAPVPTISSDTTIDLGTSVTLNSGGGSTYNWNPSTGLDDPSSSDPTASPSSTTTYTVIISENGCSAEAIVTITVKNNCGDFFIPSAFSPNNDGINDTLYVRGNCIAEVKFFVFDRWGEKMFESNQLDKGWDGKLMGNAMNTDNYTYVLEAHMR